MKIDFDPPLEVETITSRPKIIYWPDVYQMQKAAGTNYLSIVFVFREYSISYDMSEPATCLHDLVSELDKSYACTPHFVTLSGYSVMFADFIHGDFCFYRRQPITDDERDSLYLGKSSTDAFSQQLDRSADLLWSKIMDKNY
jgi:hypothetical protein